MGGHGGLNILPQKKWNVYRHDRQYEVKFDEHRDIEGKLREKESSKRSGLKNSLVELRREAQASKNKHQEDQVYTEKGRKRKHDSDRKHSDSRKDDGDSRSLAEASHISDDEEDARLVLEFDKKVTGRHINLFEDAEREFEQRAKKRREELIKSGCYVYNSKDKKNLNIYVDDDSAKLVPDFNRRPTPWYMKPKTDYSTKSAVEYEAVEPQIAETSIGAKTIKDLRAERMARESSERERALALLG
ncbi:hypothetical protein BEWA_004570 [Theileria equi strain WA]|uniref:CBF1-interacting co-repressor CIR N-terminal domain-containing protein n=1 Tax=Theileria equi strain WA TaxID=1537102 RepID=L0B1P3_THEEQ|nr:hypothetical protein BEWA_004570 [Theileria equi strain WA]AFZ81049.1 hypothetical protein BEWA_004570 [Theileria equi strain WA]|eukprot:XP_004830715.1 hypothetical protein BEWA_004570 [Theileria equi strain WA]